MELNYRKNKNENLFKKMCDSDFFRFRKYTKLYSII